MKRCLSFLLMLILCGPLLAMLTACRAMGTQKFTAFAPTQSHELESTSRTVLDVTPWGSVWWFFVWIYQWPASSNRI